MADAGKEFGEKVCMPSTGQINSKGASIASNLD